MGGGNHSNARGKPSFQKLVAAGIPNNPPRWPEATAIVKKILRAYRDDAEIGKELVTGLRELDGQDFSSLQDFHLPNSILIIGRSKK